VTESFAKSKPYLLPLAVIQPIGIGSIAAMGLADHRYAGVTETTAADGFFFLPETVAAAPFEGPPSEVETQ
jgi:hypothetical protein